MFNFMVTNEGGLTTAGYAIAIIAGIILFLAAICIAGKHSENHKHRFNGRGKLYSVIT